MSLTDAIREAYADPTVDDDPLATLELDHPTFDQPIRIIANALEDMTLGIEGGQQVLFQACPVSLVLEGVDDDGPTSGQITISNVSGKLQPYLKEAVKAGYPLEVTFRGYTVANLAAPGEVRGGLLLSNVMLNVATATGTLEPASKADRQAFPRVIYSLEQYPALHGRY